MEHKLYMTPNKHFFIFCCALFLDIASICAQNTNNLSNQIRANALLNEDNRKSGFSNDSTELEGVPEGIYAWRIDNRFGDIRPANYDTIPHRFQNENQTMGATGHYNFTGNLGAPRISHYFNEQGANMQSNPFIFTLPYDFFLPKVDDVLFTNTKSPFTNLTYHSCGNKQDGEDRLKALFSVNAGKKLGFGLKADYLYGRGYYQAQSTADFNGMVYASYLSDKYQMHAFYKNTFLKTRENGGIENDDYVKRPESFPTRYGTADMPINLSRAWNKLNGNQLFLTHRYNIGFHRYKDANGKVIKDLDSYLAARAKNKNDKITSDSVAKNEPRLPKLSANNDKKGTTKDSLKITSEFVPVSSFIHTLNLEGNTRKFISNERNDETNPGYFGTFFLSGDSALDRTNHLGIENTFALELHEGMNKWMKMGLRLFGKHELAQFKFKVPYTSSLSEKMHYTENYFTVGAQILSQQNRIFRYNILGELRTTGSDWGEFNIDGDLALSIPIKRDSLQFVVNGFVRNERPSFYYRHYIGRNAMWNNEHLNKMFHVRINASLQYKATKLTASIENIQNYVYFQEQLTAYAGTDGYENFRHAIGVAQANKNVQLLGITLNQNFHWGVFNWENELTYQVSSNKDVLPVPTFSAYSNAYLLFRIAKVLRTELGVDVRYFTRYNAPTYSPIIGQYAIQDAQYATSIGNYPIINAYANFHLKRTRFYLMASHLNYSSGAGNPFLVAHYPLNRLTIHFGISWNFIN